MPLPATTPTGSRRSFRRHFLHRIATLPIVALVAIVLQAVCTQQLNAQSSRRPNVVLIMTDDQGYGDLSVTGNEIVETPNMDRLRTEGAWLTQFYVSPVCTPTRAHLMTGRYAYRTRAIDTYLGRAVMEPEEVTVAEALSAAGYATGIFGKWHLGDYYPTRAMDQGFGESLVHQGGGLRQPSNPPDGERYHDPILFHNGRPQRYEGYCTNIFFDEAIDFIGRQAQADQPFFAYIPTNAPHGPFDEPPTRELLEHFQEKLPDDKNANRAGFYAMIKSVDDNIGRLLESLERLDLERETLVIFLTDNGPAGGGSAGPFRGAKGSVYEGGIRTVCFLRQPGTIEAGSSSAVTTAHLDLMPTILDACNVPKPAEVAFDGRSVWPLLVERESAQETDWPERNLVLQWHRGDEPQRYHHFAVIGAEGRWKLLNPSSPGRPTFRQPPQFELYDLHNDRGEQTNVVDDHPEIAARLRSAYDAWFDDVTTTRDPNFGMPPIVIGSEEQTVVVLTPQDKRVDDTDARGWWADGSWPVEIRDAGPYTIEVLLSQDAPSRLVVELSADVGSERFRQEVTVPRGVDSMALGEVELPTGQGRFVARFKSDAPNETEVYHVTIK